MTLILRERDNGDWEITGDRRDMNTLAFALHQFDDGRLAGPLKLLRDQLDRQMLGAQRGTA